MLLLESFPRGGFNFILGDPLCKGSSHSTSEFFKVQVDRDSDEVVEAVGMRD